MGHVHKPQELNRGQQPPVVYSGSIDRIDFGEKSDAKGFVLADIHRNGCEWKHVPLDVRPMIELDLDAGDAEDPTQFLLDKISTVDLTEAIVKFGYRVPQERAALVRADELRKALSAAHHLVTFGRELPAAEALVRAQGLTEALTPEAALERYLETQPRLLPRRETLLNATRALIDELSRAEDAV